MKVYALRNHQRINALTMLLILQLLLLVSCRKFDFPHSPIGKKYSNDVAIEWINLQQKMTLRTPGFGPGPAGRAFAYSGVTMYESVLPAITGFHGFVHLEGAVLPKADKNKKYYWPASVNGSMKAVLTSFFTAPNVDPTVAAANKFSIDSLYTVFAGKFAGQASQEALDRSADFGDQVGKAVFLWSGSDGATTPRPPYVLPVGSGLWITTPPAFAPAANPYGGTFRTFIPNLVDRVNVPAPVPYSLDPASDYFKMVKLVYDKSLVLTPDEVNIAKTWGDIPGNYNGPAHFTNVLSQLIRKEKVDLYGAAELYAKHGIAIQDATVIIFKSKYQYNGIRPISVIRAAIPGAENWNTLIPTPPHPEYLSAHAVIAFACSEVLKDKFGGRYAFKDYTHESLWGVRSYKSFQEYATEAGWSRILAGIHYDGTATASEKVGKDIGRLVNKLGEGGFK